jgi:hypothetical protein
MKKLQPNLTDQKQDVTDLQEIDLENIAKQGYSNNLIDEPLKGSYIMTEFPDESQLPF